MEHIKTKIPPLKDGILPLSQFFSFSNLFRIYLIISYFLKSYCCLYCEAETFQAIHNNILFVTLLYMTVVYTAKQKLFKQFTTIVCCFYR